MQSKCPDSRGKTGGEASWLEIYPGHLAETWTLPSGETLRVRPVRHDDGPLEEAFVRGLSPETGYRRLLTAGVKITGDWIDSMTHIDYARHMAFAVIEGDLERFIAVGRYVIDETQNADFAIVIADAWQGKGLGRRLLATLLAHARNAGAREMTGDVLSDNAPMLWLAQSLGFTVVADPADATVVRVRRTLDAPNNPIL